MKKQLKNSQIVGFVFLVSLLSTNLLSCRLDSGPRLTFNSVLPASSSIGQPITVTVYMNGQNDGGATGTVLIQADTSCTAILNNEIGSCKVFFTSGGTRVITADYKGDSNNGPERATYNYYVVAPLTPTPVSLTRVSFISHNPVISNPGEPVEFTVRVNALPDVGTYPTGNVTISSMGETQCTATLSNGEGKCSITFTTPDFKTITADYNGGGGWAPSRTAIDIHVSYETRVTLSAFPNPPFADQTFLVQANVSVVVGGPIPTGGVTIGNCYVALVDGIGSCQFYFAEAGKQHIIATYSAADIFTYRESSASLDITIRPKLFIPPTPKPTAIPSGGTGCMVTDLDAGTYYCVVPCPDSGSYPESCTLP